MSESIVLEVAQLICSAIMAIAQAVTPFFCAAVELFRQSIVVLALLIRKAVALPFYIVKTRLDAPKAPSMSPKEALASAFKNFNRSKLVFGLRQGLAEFQRIMDQALQNMEETERIVGFVDDDPNRWPL